MLTEPRWRVRFSNAQFPTPCETFVRASGAAAARARALTHINADLKGVFTFTEADVTEVVREVGLDGLIEEAVSGFKVSKDVERLKNAGRTKTSKRKK